MRIAPLDDAEVELSLLSPRARDESETSSETLVHDDIDIDEESVKPVLKTRPVSWKEKKGMILLTCLCTSSLAVIIPRAHSHPTVLSQGVPVSLMQLPCPMCHV